MSERRLLAGLRQRACAYLTWAAATFVQEVVGVNEARGFPIVQLGAETETKQEGNTCMVILG